MIQEIVIGSRPSRLALIQTEIVIKLLKTVQPRVDISVKTIATSGDRDRVTQLENLGISIFVKEIENALLEHQIDLAVHSLKDVPTEIPEGLALLAVPLREDPHDVLVAKYPLQEMPPGSKIGTSSLRRSIQIANLRPDLVICGLRGNMDTRLSKVEESELDGIITAAAALSRLQWHGRIIQYLPAETFLPAAGQGALVVEGRTHDTELAQLVSRINHLASWQAVTAERAFLLETGGGCRAPIAALGTIKGSELFLEGMVANPAGSQILRGSLSGPASSPLELGKSLAVKLLNSGAADFIAEVKRHATG